jgi:hypothetical protein
MFQTCGSAPLSVPWRTSNARAGSDAHPSAVLPLVPRKRKGQAWSGACRKATRAVPYLPGGARTDRAAGVERRWAITCGHAADRGEGAERQRYARSRARAARPFRRRHDSTQTQVPHFQQVHQTVLQPLHPEPVEVERWRADAPEGRRGRRAERDERGNSVRSNAYPRW